MRTCNSDVVDFPLYHFPLFEATSVTNCEVYVIYGTGKFRRILSIRAIVEAISRGFWSVFPLPHAITGLKGRSKEKCALMPRESVLMR